LSKAIKVLVPEGFLTAAISENVTIGTVMSRCSDHWYGVVLTSGERGQVEAGLGKTVSTGHATLIPLRTSIKIGYNFG
jgi:alkyl sulfatase BDS1-like metallo-beta-lactamase superfamily hydrolase